VRDVERTAGQTREQRAGCDPSHERDGPRRSRRGSGRAARRPRAWRWVTTPWSFPLVPDGVDRSLHSRRPGPRMNADLPRTSVSPDDRSGRSGNREGPHPRHGGCRDQPTLPAGRARRPRARVGARLHGRAAGAGRHARAGRHVRSRAEAPRHAAQLAELLRLRLHAAPLDLCERAARARVHRELSAPRAARAHEPRRLAALRRRHQAGRGGAAHGPATRSPACWSRARRCSSSASSSASWKASARTVSWSGASSPPMPTRRR
jgi:hypothetical protein